MIKYHTVKGFKTSINILLYFILNPSFLNNLVHLFALVHILFITSKYHQVNISYLLLTVIFKSHLCDYTNYCECFVIINSNTLSTLQWILTWFVRGEASLVHHQHHLKIHYHHQYHHHYGYVIGHHDPHHTSETTTGTITWTDSRECREGRALMWAIEWIIMTFMRIILYVIAWHCIRLDHRQC